MYRVLNTNQRCKTLCEVFLKESVITKGGNERGNDKNGSCSWGGFHLVGGELFLATLVPKSTPHPKDCRNDKEVETSV